MEARYKRKDIVVFTIYLAVLAILVIEHRTLSSSFSNVLQVIQPLFMGIAMAFVFWIPTRSLDGFMRRHSKNPEKSKRPWAILIVIVLFLSAISLIIALIVPQLIETTSTVITNVENGIDELTNNWETYELWIFNHLNIDLSQITTLSDAFDMIGLSADDIQNDVSSIGSAIGSSVIAYAGKTGSIMVNMVIGMVVAVYLLASKEESIDRWKSVLAAILPPKFSRAILENGHIVSEIFQKFITGQLLEAMLFGTMVFVAMLIAQLPYALLIAVISAVFALIPIFGNILAMIIGAIFIVVISPMQALIFIIVYQVIQQIENNLIYPRVVGSSVGLPPLWTLLAVTIFGSLYGFVGMLVAVPTMASIYVLGTKFTRWGMKRHEVHIDAETGAIADGEPTHFEPLVQKIPAKDLKSKFRKSKKE